jgi:three-Cys-motif partner protein
MSKNNKDFFKSKNSWSEIKDRLLSCYLPQYFQKLLMTRKEIFYVDCFAGKGKFDDGNDGSPIIALKIREDCIKRTMAQNACINTCFIDLNYADELKANIVDFCDNSGFLTVISGKYEEKIEQILSNKRGVNIFLYIDPYGIRALDSNLFDRFASYGFYSIELLINMNSFGFFRDACRVMKVDYKNDEALNNLEDIVEYDPTYISASQQSETLLCNIAGGDYWKDIVMDYKAKEFDGYEAEKRFSTKYKQRLREKYTYVLDMPIRLKPGQRPKYRMIHVSNHEHGCILMADNMASRSDELFIGCLRQAQMGHFIPRKHRFNILDRD